MLEGENCLTAKDGEDAGDYNTRRIGFGHREGPGFVYAMQPEGMNICKVGATTDPQQRAKSIVSHSPSPVRFRHLVRVKSKRHALLWERWVFGQKLNRSHGEWVYVDDALDMAFEEIAPALCMTDAFDMPTVRARAPKPLSEEFMEFAQEYYDLLDAFDGYEFEANKAMGFGSTAYVANLSAGIPPSNWRERLAAYKTAQGLPPSGEG